MDTKLLSTDIADFSSPLLAVFAVDIATENDPKPMPVLLCASDAVSKAAEHFLTSGEFKAGLCETLLLHAPARLRAERLLIIGLGKAATLSPDQARKGAGTAVRFAKPRGLRNVAIIFPDYRGLSDEALEHLPLALTARAIAEGAWVGDYDPDTYRTESNRALPKATSSVRRNSSPAPWSMSPATSLFPLNSRAAPTRNWNPSASASRFTPLKKSKS